MSDTTTGSKMAEIKEQLDAVAAEARSTLAGLTAADMKRPSGNSGWTVGRVAAHLSATPKDVVRVTARVRKGRDFKVPAAPVVLNMINWWRGFQNRGKTGEQLAAQFDANYAVLCQELALCADADWERTVKVSFQPEPLSLNNWWPATVDHIRGHVAEITQAPAA